MRSPWAPSATYERIKSTKKMLYRYDSINVFRIEKSCCYAKSALTGLDRTI